MIELSGGDPHRGDDFLGLSPSIWADEQGARTLASAGRFDACWPRVERALRMAREENGREALVFAVTGLAICAYLAQGASRAPLPDLRRACLEAVEIAEASGNRNLQITAAFDLSAAHFLNGDYDQAEATLTEALAQARVAGTGLEWQCIFLAVFADSCTARGDGEAAIARALEGIDFSDSGGFCFQAAFARAALADALLHAGAPELEVARVIADARALVEATGGNSLLPRLRETEVRLTARTDRTVLTPGLREAEAMYRAMGAPDPAERLARELASLS